MVGAVTATAGHSPESNDTAAQDVGAAGAAVPSGEQRCAVIYEFGGRPYRCALDDGHEGDHAWQPLDEEEDEAADEDEPADEPKDGHPVLDQLRVLLGDAMQAELVQPDEVRDFLAEFVQAFEVFNESSRHQTCDECAGYGGLFTGSLQPQARLVTCWKCQGAGYIARNYDQLPVDRQEGDPNGSLPPAIGAVDALKIPPERGGTPPAPGMTWDPQEGAWGFWQAA